MHDSLSPKKHTQLALYIGMILSGLLCFAEFFHLTFFFFSVIPINP
jgi:hypothetical protein